MAYTPPSVASAGYGDKGEARIVVNSNDPNKIKVLINAQSYDKATKQMSYEQKKYLILRSDCSEEIQPIIHATDNAFVKMSAKGDKIYTFSPWMGLFVVKFVGFATKKGEEPAPKLQVGEWEYLYFDALNEVQKGPFKGAKISYRLHYNFVEVEKDGKMIVGYSKDGPKSKHTPLLKEYLGVTGAWDRGPMNYKDNILPMLQKRMLAADHPFQMLIKNGYPSVIMDAAASIDEEKIPSDGEEE